MSATASGLAASDSDTYICLYQRDGEIYAGKSYEYDRVTEVVKGNPARSSRIRSYIRVINSMSGEKGSSTEGCRHAEAMKLEDITQVMRWSELQCPPSKFEDAPKNLDEMMQCEAWADAGIHDNRICAVDSVCLCLSLSTQKDAKIVFNPTN